MDPGTDDEAATHYDLGVAYREMGLLRDAVAELELAARDPSRASSCHAMIGMIHRELGDGRAAIEAFLRGLSGSATADQEIALLYELGDVCEAERQRDRARSFFRRVARLRPGYRDPRGAVERRLLDLGDPGPPDDAA
jgi:tetratricopeptide (TPR) repeat protein